jgi:predicted amidohydrolase
MSDRLRLALVQVDFSVGAVDDNLRRILSFHTEAGDADLLVLPKGVFSGYPPQDLVLRLTFAARAEAVLKALAARVRGSCPAALVGLPIRGPGRPHNTAVLLRPDGMQEIVTWQELLKKDRAASDGSGGRRGRIDPPGAYPRRVR